MRNISLLIFEAPGVSHVLGQSHRPRRRGRQFAGALAPSLFLERIAGARLMGIADAMAQRHGPPHHPPPPFQLNRGHGELRYRPMQITAKARRTRSCAKSDLYSFAQLR